MLSSATDELRRTVTAHQRQRGNGTAAPQGGVAAASLGVDVNEEKTKGVVVGTTDGAEHQMQCGRCTCLSETAHR